LCCGVAHQGKIASSIRLPVHALNLLCWQCGHEGGLLCKQQNLMQNSLMCMQKAKACEGEHQACATQQQLIKAGHSSAASVKKADCASEAAVAAAPTAKPKLDPKDFMYMQLTGQTRVKLPG
jgi:hypothetical protein